MRKPNILHENYTVNQSFYQLKLPLNIDCIIPDNDYMRLLSQFVEEMDLRDLYMTYSRIRGNQATPLQMLKIVLYSYMNHIYSSRGMETACSRDINFMYLREDSPVPDHATFERFRSIHFAPCANKYTFVWKKAVTKNQAKLLLKLADFIAECKELYGIRLVYQNQVKIKNVKKLRKMLYAIKSEENIEFVHGIGKRKTPL
ncbi:transposase [Tissierella pigra]|uniref:transposase n=1 Tax=Tissierella pigra TaxID=2607614 RepID=UPI001C10D608|nr:transposase [Tissierella pigra]MBU5427779.1 transposase [Tissierella pigra]